jgi:hypothetical protein
MEWTGAATQVSVRVLQLRTRTDRVVWREGLYGARQGKVVGRAVLHHGYCLSLGSTVHLQRDIPSSGSRLAIAAIREQAATSTVRTLHKPSYRTKRLSGFDKPMGSARE